MTLLSLLLNFLGVQLVPLLRRAQLVDVAENEQEGIVEKVFGRVVAGTAFLPALYELFGWQNRWKYQIIGTYLQNGSDSIVLFDTNEAVILVPPDVVTSQKEDITPLSRRGKTIPAYPDSWSASFGDDVYTQESSDVVDTPSEDWNTAAEGVSYMDPEISVKDPSEIKADINQLLEKLKSED